MSSCKFSEDAAFFDSENCYLWLVVGIVGIVITAIILCIFVVVLRDCCGADEGDSWVFMFIAFFILLGSIIPIIALNRGTDDDYFGYDDDMIPLAMNATNATYYNLTADNTTSSTNIEYETGAYGKMLHHFFDVQCLEDRGKYEQTAKMLRVFTSDLRMENEIVTVAALLAIVCLAQLGGLPTPKLGSMLALANWAVWMVAVFVQWFSTFLSLIMVCESYMLFASHSRECMVPFTKDSEHARLNLIVGMTFGVQPIFLVKLLVMYFYVVVGTEGFKVFVRTRISGERWDGGRESCCECADGVSADVFIVTMYLILGVAPPVAASLVPWVFFGGVFFTVSSSFLILVFQFVAGAVFMLVLMLIASWSNEAKDEGGVLKKIAAVIHEMTWWASELLDPSEGSFFAVLGILIGVCGFLSSSLMVFGTWAAISAYGGEDPEEFLATNALIYEFTFMGFSDPSTWSPPSFSFDPSLITELPVYLAMYLANMGDMTSADLFMASEALNALSLVVAFIKPTICWMAGFLSMFEWLNVSKNAQFSKEMSAPLMLTVENDGINGRILQTEEALVSLGAANEASSKVKRLEKAVALVATANELLQEATPEDFEGSNLSTAPLQQIKAEVERLLPSGGEGNAGFGQVNPLINNAGQVEMSGGVV